jgi:predicted Zn-dependent protease
MWEICGQQKDYLCVIEYRKRLGLPTHFNTAQYQDVRKAWKEQAEKNGVAAAEPDSEASPKPPPIGSIVIVPVGDRVAPELQGMAGFLSAQFPGLSIDVAPREELQPGVINTGLQQVVWERLLERLRDDPGRIYLLEDDLTTVDTHFVYSRFDLAHARGAVSLARFRSLVGDAKEAGTTWSGDLLVAVRNRLRAQMVAAVGKLVGLSFPCSSETCAMHERRSVKEFTLGTEVFCPRHAEELKAALQRARTR